MIWRYSSHQWTLCDSHSSGILSSHINRRRNMMSDTTSVLSMWRKSKNEEKKKHTQKNLIMWMSDRLKWSHITYQMASTSQNNSITLVCAVMIEWRNNGTGEEIILIVIGIQFQSYPILLKSNLRHTNSYGVSREREKNNLMSVSVISTLTYHDANLFWKRWIIKQRLKNEWKWQFIHLFWLLFGLLLSFIYIYAFEIMYTFI